LLEVEDIRESQTKNYFDRNIFVSVFTQIVARVYASH